MNVLAFGATSSLTSINKVLANYAANLIANAQVDLIDLNDYELPIFSTDKEIKLGIPPLAQAFFDKISDADAIIISFAEHNGSYTAAYKNIFDWASRIDQKVFQNKPVVMLSTSPGPRGGATVLAAAAGSAPYFSADLKASLAIPSFFDNFDLASNSFKNESLNLELISAVNKLG